MYASELNSEHRLRDFALGVVAIVWAIVRVPVYALLLVLEPVVGTALCLIGLLLVITAFFFRFATSVPQFPFWGMLGSGIACMMLLMLYHWLIRVFSGSGR